MLVFVLFLIVLFVVLHLLLGREFEVAPGVAGLRSDTAVFGEGLLNLLSGGHWRGSRKRFNQSSMNPCGRRLCAHRHRYHHLQQYHRK